jgi:hypothetical protein
MALNELAQAASTTQLVPQVELLAYPAGDNIAESGKGIPLPGNIVVTC